MSLKTSPKFSLLFVGLLSLLGSASSWAQVPPPPTIVRGKLGDPAKQVRFKDVYQQGSFSEVVQRELSKDTTYVLTLTATGYHPILRVESPQGVVLQTSDDYPKGLRPKITFTPKRTAKYRLVVTSREPNKSGNYSLEIAPEARKGPFQIRVTKFAGTGTLPSGKPMATPDGRVVGSLPIRAYNFKLTGAPNGLYVYTVKVTADNFTPTFTVSDSKGKQLTQGKPKGNRVTERSFLPPSQGKYQILLQGQNVPDAGGTYRIEVVEEITR